MGREKGRGEAVTHQKAEQGADVVLARVLLHPGTLPPRVKHLGAVHPVTLELPGQLGGHLGLLQGVVVRDGLVLGALLHRLDLEQLVLNAAGGVEELFDGAARGLVRSHLLVQHEVHLTLGIVGLLLLGAIPLWRHVLTQGSEQLPAAAMQGERGHDPQGDHRGLLGGAAEGIHAPPILVEDADELLEPGRERGG